MAGDITTIARPYAEAAFEYAKEAGQVDAWSQALELLAAVTSDSRLVAQLNNPSVARETLRELIVEVCGDALPAEVANLLKLLAHHSRLVALPEIARLFEQRRIADQGVRHVLIRTAHEIDDAQRDALTKALASRFGAEVDLAVETDRTLIGGIEIRAGDTVIDDTVRGKITQLAHALQF